MTASEENQLHLSQHHKKNEMTCPQNENVAWPKDMKPDKTDNSCTYVLVGGGGRGGGGVVVGIYKKNDQPIWASSLKQKSCFLVSRASSFHLDQQTKDMPSRIAPSRPILFPRNNSEEH